VAGLAPDVYWLDSSELAAAAWQLGVAHPPGHGLAALLGKAATLLPFGTVALRVGLASAVAGAIAAALTAMLSRDVAGRVRAYVGGEPSRADEWIGAAAGLSFGLSYAAGFQAVRPEVYALSAALVLATLRGLERFDATGDRRWLYAAAVWAGLALTNHHLLALAALVPAAGIFLWKRKVRWAFLLAAGALGMALIAYLPLRAARHPLVDWGAPTTAARVFWTVSAQAFQKAVATRGSSADLPAVAAAVARELHLIGALLALAGAYLSIRVRELRRVGLGLLAAAAADAAMPALVGFDPANPDAYGYLEVAIALLAVLAGVLPAALFARSRRAAQVGGPSLAAATLLAGLLGFPRVSLADDGHAARTMGGWLGAMPTRAVLITSYFQTVFGVWYLQSVEGARPDVDLVHRHFLPYPGYGDEVRLRSPALAPILGARDVQPAPLGRPLVIEYDLDLSPVWLRSSTVVPADPRTADPQALRFAAWQAYLAVHRACRLGDTAGFVRRLAHARAVIGPSPELDALAASCGK
jgi:hypothetical protein